MASLEAPGPMVVPADLMARVAPLVGAPFLIKGETPDGWDCRGCVRWILREHLGVSVETYQDAYAAADVVTARGAIRRSQAIAERLAAWRSSAAQPGAVVHLQWLGRGGHVGLMLDRRHFIHADVGSATTIGDLKDRSLHWTPVGFFLPRFVTEVIHA